MSEEEFLQNSARHLLPLQRGGKVSVLGESLKEGGRRGRQKKEMDLPYEGDIHYRGQGSSKRLRGVL